MDRVKELIAEGRPTPEAIKRALLERTVSVDGVQRPISIGLFADKYDLSRTFATEVLALSRTPRMDVCTALAAELGGEPLEWARLLWEAAEPRPAAA